MEYDGSMDGQALEACSYDNKQCMIEMGFFFSFFRLQSFLYIYIFSGKVLTCIFCTMFGQSLGFFPL